MVDYNFNFEITKNLKMFESAFDDAVIKRYLSQTAQDTIKVPYLYGIKSRLLQDLRGQPDAVKFPIVSIITTGMSRDDKRLKNKTDDILYRNDDGNYVNLQAIPWNIDVKMTILCKYQEDLNQIIQNFAVNTNPYIVYSWQEPKTGRKINTEVYWDGSMELSYPPDPLPADVEWRVEGSANFTIKTWLFKTVLPEVKPICYIPNDIIVTNNFYCDYATLTAATSGTNDRYSNEIFGKPIIRFVNPFDVEILTTPLITIQGDGFANTYAVVVSGNNEHMFKNSSVTLTANNFTFQGAIVQDFNIDSAKQLTFSLPAPSASGKFDIIVVNPCGYGQLTVDADRTGRDKNPYSTTSPYYSTWELLQYPYLSGVNVYGSFFGPCVP